MTQATITVLHLEDSDLDAGLIHDRLQRSDLSIVLERVANRAGFLKQLTSRRYDLILSDYSVPAFDGLEALELARCHQSGVPFIFVSGAMGEEVAIDALRQGATDYVLKERLARLVPAVERALAEAHERAERRRIADDLARREEELRIITDAVPALISYVDASGVYRFVNRQYEVWFAQPREQLVGRPVREVVGEPLFEAIRPAIERVLQGERLEFETFAPYLNGESRHIHVNYVPRLEGDQVVGFFALVADINDAKLAEERLRQSEQRSRFVAGVSAALADLTDPVSTLQKVASLTVPHFADGCVVDLLDDLGVLQRLAVAHADPTRMRELAELAERYPPRPEDCSGIPRVLRTGESELVEEIGDALLEGLAHDAEHLRRLKGLGLWSHILVPIRTHDRLMGVLTFLTAESGRRYTNDDLAVAEDLAYRAGVALDNARLYQALRDADCRKDEFLATLAHELRNPLAPIRNAVSVFHKLQIDLPEFNWGRDLIDRQVAHLTRLIDDLLDISRIARDRIELHRERIALATVINGALEASRPLINQLGHVLTVSLPPTPVYVEGDLVRLSQVMTNLLTNAAKYTPPRGRIWLTAECQAGEVIVRVKDTGIGIPSEQLHSLFDLFYQVDGSLEKAQGGLGIGLSLVKRLVELHGGTVEAHSPGVNQGSEFVVRLPVPVDQAVALPTEPAERREPSRARSRRVLIVDDNRDAADSLALMLQLNGHEVCTANDGLQALTEGERFKPEVVLLDLGMPRLNGYDACRQLREQTWGQGIFVVALTGWGQEEDRRRSREAGFDHHLVKPVDPFALVALLAELRQA